MVWQRVVIMVVMGITVQLKEINPEKPVMKCEAGKCGGAYEKAVDS